MMPAFSPTMLKMIPDLISEIYETAHKAKFSCYWFVKINSNMFYICLKNTTKIAPMPYSYTSDIKRYNFYFSLNPQFT